MDIFRTLRKVNEEVINLMKNDLADDCAVTLIQDVWSTVSNDPIIALNIHNGSTDAIATQ